MKVYGRSSYKTASFYTKNPVAHKVIGSAEAVGSSDRATMRPKSDTEELVALRAANAALTQRLREIEEERPEERDARNSKLKNAKIEQLKSSVEKVTAKTEAINKKILERQAHLRELNAQIAKLQPWVPYKIQGRRKKKGENKESKAEQTTERAEAWT